MGTNVVFDLNRNEIKSLYGKNYKGEEADDVAMRLPTVLIVTML